MALIFDIETVGLDFDILDDVTKVNLTRWIERESGDEISKYNLLLSNLKEGLGFSPLTGEIIALGVYDTVKNSGVVYYQAPKGKDEEWSDGSFTFKTKSEEAMIELFWKGATHYEAFVSFNGRSFDVPFILIRGAKYKIRPAVDLMTDRYLKYSKIKHIDLQDQLAFYGAVRKKGNLHLYCQALGINSPKAAGISGYDIKNLFKNKKYKEIAEYNSWDLIATWELYEIWKSYIKPVK